MKWLILISGILSNATASVLIKIAMLPPRQTPNIADPMSIITNWPLWLGLFLYGLAFMLYAMALTRLPLSVAHPILTAGSIAMVAFFSFAYFKENLTFTLLLGILFVILGVVLISFKA